MKNIKLFASILLATSLLIACSERTTKDPIEIKIEKILSRMTLKEKIGQMNQLSYGYQCDDLVGKIRNGEVGSILNIVDADEIDRLQRTAIEESRLGIPLIIGRDIIHGFKTIFPIPLGQAASFDREVVETGARIAAVEARSKGINWTFAPMLDISRDARWGRIAESFGEDSYLTAEMGIASVKGYQGEKLSSPHSIAACIKHFVGYGAAEGGRDYNSTNISPLSLRNVYLPPFQKAIETGAATLMTSFNDNDGIPASGNDYLLKDILRQEWKFDGFVVSDWASMSEMIAHGFARDSKEVTEISIKAGIDMEMVSGAYSTHLQELVNSGVISMSEIDNAARNILRIKLRMGLFENPYCNHKDSVSIYSQEHLQGAKTAAVRSAILLKNTGVLPLNRKQKVAIIGPMADAPHDQLGTWVFDGEKEHTITPFAAIEQNFSDVEFIYEPALTHSRDKDITNFAKAKQAAARADVSIVFVGEEAILSGEAHSLSNLNLVGAQSELLKAVKSVGKPVVMVVMAGRPLTIERDLPYADAVLYNFHPGTMGGPAILDLLYGIENPSGKLPVTFVREVGQIPMYYNHNNTGRPTSDNLISLDDIPLEAVQTSLGNTSFYLDSGCSPLFPFGYGLSYTSFEFSDLKLSSDTISAKDSLAVRMILKNTGKAAGAEIVQLYVRDLVGSVVRPVKELKGFERIYLKPGESKIVIFTLLPEDLAFYDRNLNKTVEAGKFHLWVGNSSEDARLKGEFTLVNHQ